jgi:two-component system chemotaxis sensor kinase CheA
VLPAPPSDTSERQAVLLFESGSSEQFAVPLAMVRRIQPVRAAEIEHVGREEIVAVDGVPVPVLRLEQVLSVSPCREQDDYYLILPKNARRLVGVLASRLIDTDALSVSVHLEAVRGAGLVGSALVRGRTTLFLDLYRLADLGTPPAGEPTPRSHRGRVLLVEDTQFFRQLVRGYLEAAGFDVTTAENGVEGLARLDQGVGFDLVVSDIEMPVMDGWSFARAIRRRAEGRELPLMALTTLNSSADRDRASECGFDRYEVKIDRERFLATLESLLRERGRA